MAVVADSRRRPSLLVTRRGPDGAGVSRHGFAFQLVQRPLGLRPSGR
jgi:hypothetical protein